MFVDECVFEAHRSASLPASVSLVENLCAAWSACVRASAAESVREA